MSGSKADLLLHPVRLRILQTFIGGELLTAGQVATVLSDVPPATLYRHLGALVRGGILHVDRERRVRGTVDRVYRLGSAVLTQEDLAGTSPEDHLRHFVTFVSGLVGEYTRYLRRSSIDLERDSVGYRCVGLYLTDEELTDLMTRVRASVGEAMSNRPAAGRRRRLLATILMPAQDVDQGIPGEIR